MFRTQPGIAPAPTGTFSAAGRLRSTPSFAFRAWFSSGRRPSSPFSRN